MKKISLDEGVKIFLNSPPMTLKEMDQLLLSIDSTTIKRKKEKKKKKYTKEEITITDEEIKEMERLLKENE